MADSFIPVTALPKDFVPDLPAPSTTLPADVQGAPTAYTSSILPFSRDASGTVHFDPNAGILGALKSAVTLPGDVYSGQQPLAGPQGGIDPSLVDRTLGMAATITPMSAAMRAGELQPGMLTQKNVPTTGELKSAADIGYKAARASGLEIEGAPVANMAINLAQGLTENHGIIGETAPKTFSILNRLANPPEGGFVTIPGLDAARQGLSNLSIEGGTEGLAAGNARRGLDDFMSTLGADSLRPGYSGSPPAEEVAQTLANARGNYAAAQRSNDITGSLDRANTGILDRAEARAAAANSGKNFDNATRQRIASFLQNPANVAGFSQPEIDALNKLVQGGAVQNAVRYIGNLLGGGGGLGHLLGMGSGFMIGRALGGDAEGGAIGAMVPASLGISAKAAENAIARRNLEAIDKLIRQRSPLYQARTQGGIGQVPAMVPNALAVRGLLPGLFGPDTQ